MATVAAGLVGLAGAGSLTALGAALALRPRPYAAGGIAVAAGDPVATALRHGLAGVELHVRLDADGDLHVAAQACAAGEAGETLRRAVLEPLAERVKPTAH